MNFKTIQTYLSRGLLILGAILVIYNTFRYTDDLLKMQERRQKIPYFFIGNIFSGLEPIFKNSTKIGYMTDRDIEKNDEDNRRFSQGQYVLAPTILDLNNTQHEFLIFDFKNQSLALNKINEINATPLKRNQFGLILVKNPNWSPPPHP